MTIKRLKAIATKQIENERVIVTEWRFEVGAETGWHKHGHDYIVVPGLDGNLLLESKQDDKNEDEKVLEKVAALLSGQSDLGQQVSNIML